MPTSEKRRYTKLSVDEWNTITETYQSGISTLQEIADKYNVSIGAILSQAKARGIARRGAFPAGAAIKALAGGASASVAAALIPPTPHASCKPTAASQEERIRATNDDGYNDAVAIQRLLRLAIAALPAPTTQQEAAATIRAADMAVTALDRANRVRRAILRLDRDNVDADIVLPELPITEMTDAEVTQMREAQEREDREQYGDAVPVGDISEEPEVEDIEIVTEE